MIDRRHHPWWVHVLAFLVSPISEKNATKVLASFAPIMLSGSRVTVAVFAYVMAKRLLETKTAMGWPESTIVLGLIFALPILAALEKVSPQDVVAFGEKIVGRFGLGDVAKAPFTPHEWADGNPQDGDL
ncbi:MAG: hypothetical protein Q8K82_13560 [Gemmatimonadaceae bacterium]|nr:hypothetical protein [Gemmatimonadaceae bacterium]